MKSVSHEEQRNAWENEHAAPHALLQMDSKERSGGVQKFYDFLVATEQNDLCGLEMGCGKGRNVIWLAKQKGIAHVSGFDFSSVAVIEARKRASEDGLPNVDFKVADATAPWPYESESFDFAVDCFASTDIESRDGRAFANSEFFRVLKPGGYLMVYALSVDDQYHKLMAAKSPSSEEGAFVNDQGKFEKSFTEAELLDLHSDFALVKKERVSKKAEFFHKEYECHHYWLVFEK